jgi:glycosyltransferase involved in cell wall biosynthesis
MNICHVNLASGYHGGENQTLQLIKQQASLGYNLIVVANPKSPFADAIRKLNIRLVLTTHFTQAHSKSVTEGCDVVHVHEGRAIYWALIQNLLYGIPYIITRRIDNPLKKKWLANIAYTKAKAVVGLSNTIVRRVNDAYPQITTYKIPSSPVTYTCSNHDYQTLIQRFKGKTVIIHAANMLKHKGFDVTIRAARMLQSIPDCPPIHFCLLGDGPEKSHLMQQAQDLHNLSFEGKQDNMGTWFSIADLQIHPSYTEGLGSVILEGMAAGLPVIATNTGGIPDIIEHNINGILIEPGHSEGLAQEILSILCDDSKRQHFIHNSTEKLKTFAIAYTANQYVNVYENALR